MGYYKERHWTQQIYRLSMGKTFFRKVVNHKPIILGLILANIIFSIPKTLILDYDQFENFNSSHLFPPSDGRNDKWGDLLVFQTTPSFAPGFMLEVYFNDYRYMGDSTMYPGVDRDHTGMQIILTTIPEITWNSYNNYRNYSLSSFAYTYKNGKISKPTRKVQQVKKPNKLAVIRDSIYISDNIFRDSTLKLISQLVKFPSEYENNQGLDGTDYTFSISKYFGYNVSFRLWDPESTSKAYHLLQQTISLKNVFSKNLTIDKPNLNSKDK
ncbi:MAG: hypothetical protein JNL74_00505 [Fibrobacteres bacterium]|nr:hypothetical protein [Fibrobacterota bacterium]